jgi:hypothetical protein
VKSIELNYEFGGYGAGHSFSGIYKKHTVITVAFNEPVLFGLKRVYSGGDIVVTQGYLPDSRVRSVSFDRAEVTVDVNGLVKDGGPVHVNINIIGACIGDPYHRDWRGNYEPAVIRRDLVIEAGNDFPCMLVIYDNHKLVWGTNLDDETKRYCSRSDALIEKDGTWRKAR